MSLLLAWTGSSLPHTFGAAPPIWLSNAVLLAILLRSPRVLWLPLAGLGTVGMAIAGLLAGNPPALAAALALCNGLEVLLAALALQRVIGTGDIARPANVARFILTITVAAILGGALSALVVGLPFDRATFAELLIWVTADLTGLAVVTPSLYLLHLFWPSVRKLAGWQVWPLALHVAVTILVFALSQQPLTYLVAVSLIFTTYRLRMVGASLGVLATMTIALAATLMGRGPFILMDGGLADRVLALQAFLAICFYMSVPIAVQRHRSIVASVLLEAAHDETRAAEAKYRRIAESTVDLIVQSDLEGRLTYVSPSCSSLGFAPERLVGSLSVDGLHPDDRARFVELRSRLLSEGVEPPRGDWRFRIRCASGDYRLFEARPTVVRDDLGQAVGIEAIYRDVTEAMAAQEALAESALRYRHLAENVTDVVASYGVDGLLTYLSPSVEGVLGYKPEELVGVRIGTLVHPEEAESVRAQFAAARTAVPPQSPRVEFRMRRKDGAYLWLEAHPRPILDPATGAFREWQDLVRDISARKVVEEELRAGKAQAEAEAEANAEFLADMSHELRTPLASVLGFTRLAAAAGNLEEPTRTYVERVRDASQGLIALVNNILELSKLEAGGINLRPRSVDVSAVTRSSLEMFEPQAQEKGLRLRLIDDLPEGLRLRVDPDRLRQVLVNLIGNAVKFTVEGSVTVALGYDADKALLSMAVWDTGPGIALAAQERLFKRFSRVGDRAQGGTGLGLAICKGIVEGMGGEISATSRKGEGSRFAISAPAERANEIGADADPDVERLEILVGGGPAELPGLIQMLLQDRAEVVALADARAAIAMAKKRHFDLLILDATPRSGGVDALRKIRGGAGPSQHAPAIAVTAEPTSAARRLEGFASVIGQTVAAEELVSAIAHAMLMGRYDGSASDSEDEDHPVAAAVQ